MRVFLFVSFLLYHTSVLLSWSYHAGRHTAVKNRVCAAMSQKWIEIGVKCTKQCPNVCSKGLKRYEIAGTGVGDSGEDEQKTGVFVVRKPTVFPLFTGQNFFPRARRRSASFEMGVNESSTNFTRKVSKQMAERWRPAFYYLAVDLLMNFSKLSAQLKQNWQAAVVPD